MGDEKAPLKQSRSVIFVVPALCGLSTISPSKGEVEKQNMYICSFQFERPKIYRKRGISENIPTFKPRLQCD